MSLLGTGLWHKGKTTCDYCHGVFDQILVVQEGKCQGKFCSVKHYHEAADAMQTKEVPEHEYE